MGDVVVAPVVTVSLGALFPLSAELLLGGAMIAWIDMGSFISLLLVTALSKEIPNSDCFWSFV